MMNQTTTSRAPRLRPWYLKLVYFAASCALVYLIAAIPVAPGGAGILRSAFAFVLILVGARVFRGPDEDDSARAWWRMTARVPAGILLGSLLALVALVSAAGYVGLMETTLAHKDVVDLPALLVNLVLAAILSYLYYDSSWRLAREPSAEAVAAAGKGR
jgi:membrane protease YdiL (CAAX protease family)